MIETWYNNLANLLKEKSISPLKLRNKPLTDVSNPSQLEQDDLRLRDLPVNIYRKK